jgi:toxin CcdB
VAQFQAYDNPDKLSRKGYPFLLDIQSNLIGDANSTIVIPLAPAKGLQIPISRLSPLVTIDGVDFFVITQQISGFDRKSLGKPKADLTSYRHEIVSAIDFVISGF